MIDTSPVFHARSHKGYRALGTSDLAPLRTPFTFSILLPVPGMGLLEYIPHHGSSHQCGWATEAEAEAARGSLTVAWDKNVHAVLRNADFTEGRGPMLLHKIFRDLGAAELYISQQDGIYGSRQYREVHYGVNIHGDLYGSVTRNGYNIESIALS